MRLLKTALALSGLIGWACGGSSSDGLFKGAATGGVASFGGLAAGGDTSSAGSNGGEATNVGGGSPGGTTSRGGSSPGGGASTGGTAFGSGGHGAGGVAETGGGGSSNGGVPQPTPDAGPAGAGGMLQVVCPSGQFKGNFSGPYKSLTGTNEIGASIAFAVDGKGSVSGTFTGPGNAKATLAGKVDCTSGVLTVSIEEGSYPGVFGNVSFSGTLGGQYSTTSRTFVNGTWDITEPSSSGNGGTGTWAQQ